MCRPGSHSDWEYLILPEPERERLAALGRDGWELVAVGGSAEDGLLYFKRTSSDLRERVTLEQRNRYYESLGLDPNRTGERVPE